MLKIILDPVTGDNTTMRPDAAPEDYDLTGKTVVEVDDDFTWAGKRVDWSSLTIIDDLTRLKTGAAELVNDQAEAFRLRFLTPGAGQAATYLRKETEARAWVSGGDPAAAPFLAREAESTGMTIDEVAALVIAQADAWISMGSKIEGLRRGAAVAIAAAGSIAAINAAATVDWESLLT